MNLANRTVAITGASRGLGAGIAAFCHEHSMRLALCARERSPVPAVVSEQFDISDSIATAAFCQRAEAELGHIDLWLNNAGILDPICALRNAESSAFRRHLDVNVLGVFHGSHAYIGHVRRTGKPGVLINISSGAGRRGYYGWSAYCASKAAVDRMSECIALEEADIDLRVHALAPGIIDTDMQAQLRACSADDFPDVERFRQFKVENAFTKPEHVAHEIMRLAFDPACRSAEVILDLRD